MAATIRDVAKKAGVGVGTVSRVLNGSPAVSTETRQRVLAAIDALDYSPNITARRLSLGKSLSIGVVVPFFTNPSVVERLRGVVSVLKKSQYDMVLFDVETSAGRELIMRDVTRRERVDGLLIISIVPKDREVERLLKSEITAVLVDAYHPLLSSVTVDNIRGGYIATKHLIELGHLNIAYISDYLHDPFNSPVRDRFAGYQQALKEAGIPFKPAYHQQGEHGREPARSMTKQLLNLDTPPTAIFAYSDTQAFGVIEAATQSGLKIPEHLSVVGFDNIEAAEYFQLTTISQNLFQSGVRGAELLLKQLSNQSQEPEHIVLETTLINRKSTSFPA
ncbi:MAG: LacI family transcriptional regulator [Candidatus Thermofonsia bacterium]|nr:MAG: LacI family transcriptional regulator [Candidatus Thermofonsia bacterium]